MTQQVCKELKKYIDSRCNYNIVQFFFVNFMNTCLIDIIAFKNHSECIWNIYKNIKTRWHTHIHISVYISMYVSIYVYVYVYRCIYRIYTYIC